MPWPNNRVQNETDRNWPDCSQRQKCSKQSYRLKSIGDVDTGLAMERQENRDCFQWAYLLIYASLASPLSCLPFFLLLTVWRLYVSKVMLGVFFWSIKCLFFLFWICKIIEYFIFYYEKNSNDFFFSFGSVALCRIPNTALTNFFLHWTKPCSLSKLHKSLRGF